MEEKLKKWTDCLDIMWLVKINNDLVKRTNQNFTSDFCIIEINE